MLYRVFLIVHIYKRDGTIQWIRQKSVKKVPTYTLYLDGLGAVNSTIGEHFILSV